MKASTTGTLTCKTKIGPKDVFFIFQVINVGDVRSRHDINILEKKIYYRCAKAHMKSKFHNEMIQNTKDWS